MTPLVLLLLLGLLVQRGDAALVETKRLEEYRKRNYTWPVTETNPNTDGWKRLMYRRLAQVERIQSDDDRYNGWMSVMSQAISVPNFTENGWGLARAPAEIVEELKDSLRNGMADAKEEHYLNVIDTAERPLWIKQDSLNQKVLETLKPMHEEWSGVPLEGSLAYGLRVYRNNSLLYMHVDRLRTHVISCILHVDHSEDSDPWPIFIEDYQGNTNEVILESGDMLFYGELSARHDMSSTIRQTLTTSIRSFCRLVESSKVIHGRPRRFNGSWYSSIFVHYQPVGWDMDKADLEPHYAIPAHWHTAQKLDPRLEELIMISTSMYEPQCPDLWCGTKKTVKWKGPGIEGKVITTGFKYDNNLNDEL
jgi:hypothetical protein